MPVVKIRVGLWKGLVAAAEKQHRKPEALANEALKDFLGRMEDEELLNRSAVAARRSSIRVQDAEAAVRRFRLKK